MVEPRSEKVPWLNVGPLESSKSRAASDLERIQSSSVVALAGLLGILARVGTR